MPKPVLPTKDKLPKVEDVDSAAYDFGDFKKDSSNDEVLVPVMPGKAPKKNQSIEPGVGNKVWLIIVVAIVAIGGFSYFMYTQIVQDSGEDETVNVEYNVEIDTNLDSDFDGLTDVVEAEIGTDKNNPDTDGDGYEDGIEVDNGYDPLRFK